MADRDPDWQSLEPPRDAAHEPEDALLAPSLELDAAVLRDPLDVRALDHVRDRVFDRLTFRPLPLLLWPESWYIPADADFKQHWFLPPPDDHRYRWADHDAQASLASAADGRLFSYHVPAWQQVPSYVGYARVGIYLQPTATLATYRLSASVDLEAQWRWWFLPQSTIPHGSIGHRADVEIHVWQWNPATRGWELLPQRAARPIVRATHTGQGGMAIAVEHETFDDLRLDVQLQGGRLYAAAICFRTEVVYGMHDLHGRPWLWPPGDDVKLWIWMAGVVSRIVARRTVTWIP